MSEDLGFAVLSATPLPLLVTSRDTRIVFGNVAAARLVGRPVSSLPGAWLAEFVRSPHGRVRRLAVVASGAPHPLTAEVSLRVGRRNQIRTMIVVAALDRSPLPGSSERGILLWQLSTAPSAHVLPDAPGDLDGKVEGEDGPLLDGEAVDGTDDLAGPVPLPDGDLAVVAGLLGEDGGVLDVDGLARRAVELAAGVAGVPHVRLYADAGPHRGPVLASVGDLAALAGQAESQLPGGPSELAAAGQRVVVDDLAGTSRWDGLAHRLAEGLGVRSLVAVPLSIGEGLTGVLSVYGEQPDVAGRNADRLHAFSTVLGPVLGAVLRETAARAEAAQLREAMSSRAAIEQAKGIIMARQGVDADTAFELLRRESMVRNERLRDVAAGLVGSVAKS